MPAFLITFLLLITTIGFAYASMVGEIVEAACSIATDDVWQEVDFGTVSLSNFTEGNEPASKPFHIHLSNCVFEKNGGLWKDVIVTIDGKKNDIYRDLFGLTGVGQGISIQITDDAGNKVIPGNALSAAQLYEKNANLHFKIHLARNNDDLVAGDVTSFILFMMAYQ